MKALSDLAMVSAGDSTMEVDKVACFRSAVMGFAPFVFDLRQSCEGLHDVIQCVLSVDEFAKRDTALLRNWVNFPYNANAFEIPAWYGEWPSPLCLV